jgi:plasmid stabilization system protein ParE
VKVVLTTEARIDLERIADYIAQDDPARARSFVGELLAKAREIGETPRGFPLVPRFAQLQIRRRAYRSYLIFFRLEETQVVIVHVLHGARDYEALLFPDD